MLRESPRPFSPRPEDLPLLFEIVRLFRRHQDTRLALAEAAALAAGRGGLEGLALAWAEEEGRAPRLLLAGAAGGLAEGEALGLGRGLLGRAWERGGSVEGERDRSGRRALATAAGPVVLAAFEGRGVAEPGGPAEARARGGADSGFLPAGRGGAEDARRLLEDLAALLAEELAYRDRLREEGREALEDEGPRPARLSRASAGRAGAAPAGAAGLGAGRRREPAAPAPGGLLVGASAAMEELRALIARLGPTESTVLVTGESGTGKELAARALHEASRRAGGPFVAVNCAALPESLIESELFGHERGAFTGAYAARRGRFELAAGGTLLLDEVAELGPAVQAKLLRVLQERSYERVGGQGSLRADVRVLAATNRDLRAEVAAGRFREDLLWRLDVLSLRMPPLRERGGDVVLLADHFAETKARAAGKPILRISTPALDLLTSYHWPGNVRELENAIERAVALSSDGVIHAYHLPPSLQSAASTGTGPSSGLDPSLARLEKELVVEALKAAAGNAAAAGRALGITERRMGLLLRKYGIDWRRFRTRR